jgi:hypothetical protein
MLAARFDNSWQKLGHCPDSDGEAPHSFVERCEGRDTVPQREPTGSISGKSIVPGKDFELQRIERNSYELIRK